MVLCEYQQLYGQDLGLECIHASAWLKAWGSLVTPAGIGKQVRWKGSRSSVALFWGGLWALSCNSREGWAFPNSSWVQWPYEAVPGILMPFGLWMEFHVGVCLTRTHWQSGNRLNPLHFSATTGDISRHILVEGCLSLSRLVGAGGSLMTAERVGWDYGGGEWVGDSEEQLCSSGLTSKKIPCVLLPPFPQVGLSSSQPLFPNTLCTQHWLSYHAIIMCFNSIIPLRNGLFFFSFLSSYHIFDIQ